MAYGQTHTETIPTVGVTPQETYATMINDVLTEMRVTLNAKVTPAGIDINADLSMRSGATYSGITDAHRLSLRQHASAISAATYPAAFYAVNGDAYFNDGSGNQIQLTTGGTVNVSSTGGITGTGYGETGVEVNWDSGTPGYHFYSAAATYATILTAGMTVAADGHVTVSGTGKFKHGTEILSLAAVSGQSRGFSANIVGPGGGNKGVIIMGDSAEPWYMPLPLPVGASISRIDFYFDPAGAGTKTFSLWSIDGTTEVNTEHETTTSTTTSTGPITLTVSPEVVITAGSMYVASFDAGNNGDELFHIEVYWNRP